MPSSSTDRLSIAILALGGQGGGVLADWIQNVARGHGWVAQGTSVPGVAQRTGSTVYYVELARADAAGRAPIMAQMPMPGDVDIVVASELMETGRAVLRGFSSAGRTTLIGSTHRIYAISEKSAMADGRGNSEKIIAAAQERSKRFIGFDMEAATDRTSSVISAIMFGALAGSEALPFPRESFEQAIRDSGIAVQSNLTGFEEGFTRAQGIIALPEEAEHPAPEPTTEIGRQLYSTAAALLPQEALHNVAHGLARLVDYQDANYARLYLDRLRAIAEHDEPPYNLTSEAARHLALWMSYEDTIRVADLKTRASRMERVREEVKAQDGQLVSVTEFMHPRLQELGETLPAPIGRRLLSGGLLARLMAPFFKQGRHVRTTGLRWFLVLRATSALRGLRRRSVRYVEEQERIDAWLSVAADLASRDVEAALEWIKLQQLIKGYGDTFERGLRNYLAIRSEFLALPEQDQTAAWLHQAREQAFAQS
ncbi:indolepyruvate oxidoreductase subunit beta family protein [Altericroceibacterium endophyticum]|uniref:Indolepyruvate oxidoreductase subunit beta family protein n=1 Tax=Altericroceibacterium endophyticum TaxID=1808508 RepID=A0A6I4TA56_9SPHN|nr:indolepyruvate oxidoreductase subunit beta family protein [Altericroceibacterium endophyticum]MXO67051.1 indolepyruvate oxidoreductase subunit beta family protein [Altericroceibacterium endophyticum]